MWVSRVWCRWSSSTLASTGRTSTGGSSRWPRIRRLRCRHWWKLEDVPPLIERIQGARRSAGRETEPFEIFLSPRGDPEPDTYRRLEQMGVTAVILPSWSLQEADLDSLDAKRRQMERFATEFM